MEKENKIVPAGLAETKPVYEVPVLEIVEVTVERGFQSSPDSAPASPSSEPEGGHLW